MNLNIQKIRNDFPILSRQVYGKPLVYFDNGATTQKPRIVIDTVRTIMEQENSSVHRGIHYLSEEMTSRYETARETVRAFINARSTNEVIFTSGATGSINAVAFSFGERFVKKGDEILITAMEHHSNIVPWQMLCERKGASLKVLPFNDQGELETDQFEQLLNEKTRLVAIVYASNSLGTVNPVKDLIEKAHKRNIPVLVDGAQIVQHGKIDVQDLDCDFFAFSGHKIYGPTGIGVLYGKENLLEQIPPYQGGGDMIDCVTFEKTTYNALPFKFEAGTSNYTGAIGMGVALEYIQKTGLDDIALYEHDLLKYATEKLSAIERLKIYGTAKEKISVISFLLEGIHPYDAGMILDKMGIAVRTGTHCTQPVMDHFQIGGTIRASLVFYNTMEEIDRLEAGIRKVITMLG